MANTIRIAFVGRLKNAALSEFLIKKNWTQTRLAKELDVALPTVNRWMLLQTAPKNEALLHKIEELLGQLREDIFPEFFQTKEWQEFQEQLSPEQIFIREVPVHTLIKNNSLFLSSPEVEYEKKELRVCLKEAFSALSSTEEEILKRRFGLIDGDEHTLKQIGDDLNLSRERIRLLELGALKKLGLRTHGKRLHSFFE